MKTAQKKEAIDEEGIEDQESERKTWKAIQGVSEESQEHTEKDNY